MIIEKLKFYSGKDETSCLAALEICATNFWQALFYLTKRHEEKERAVDNLVDSISNSNYIEPLKNLAGIYSAEKFTKLKIQIYQHDKDFFLAIGKPSGREQHGAFVPTDKEIEIYSSLLDSDDLAATYHVLKILGYISAEHFGDPLVVKLKNLLKGGTSKLVQEFLLTNCSDQPEKTDLFLDEIIYNLRTDRTENHFHTVRVFWGSNVKLYPETIPYLKKICKSHNSQERDMANTILTRHNQLTQEQVNTHESKRRQHELQEIRHQVTGLQKSSELHRFADRFNWDDDIEYMFTVINHSKCESATAKLIYWRSTPTHFQKFETDSQLSDHDKSLFKLQRAIEVKMEKGAFKKGDLVYDPKNDQGFDQTKNGMSPEEIKKPIPNYMY